MNQLMNLGNKNCPMMIMSELSGSCYNHKC